MGSYRFVRAERALYSSLPGPQWRSERLSGSGRYQLLAGRASWAPKYDNYIALLGLVVAAAAASWRLASFLRRPVGGQR